MGTRNSRGNDFDHPKTFFRSTSNGFDVMSKAESSVEVHPKDPKGFPSCYDGMVEGKMGKFFSFFTISANVEELGFVRSYGKTNLIGPFADEIDSGLEVFAG
jgi:hypothetical protein